MKENFPKWPETKKTDKEKAEAQAHYDKQSGIIKEALSTPNHSLNELIKLMRERGETAVYLCGTRLDSDYCFGSNELGTAISALPQDGEKAAEPGFHPGSTEVYVIFQGSLIMESLKSGHLCTQNCGQFDVVVIPPGQCHGVRNEQEREAASFIVKTNPHHKPSILRCNKCSYYSDPNKCPVYMSWLREKNELSK